MKNTSYLSSICSRHIHYSTYFFLQTMFLRGFFPAICAALLLAPNFLAAQRHITPVNNQMIYSETFNSLPGSNANNTLQWTDNQTLLHWYAARTGYTAGSTLPMRATDGSYGGPHLCSFRTGNTNVTPNIPTSANRALGAIAAGSNGQKTHFAWGVRFKNTSGSVLRRITVTYAMEQWRKSESTNLQPLRFSYKIAASPITNITADEDGYSKVPFLNTISPVTAGGATSLNGDNSSNRVVVTHSFNITINNNEEIMLKWFDEDDNQMDHGLAIDDLTVQFSTAVGTFDAFTGATPFDHFMKSIILDIPDETSPIAYIVPSPTQRSTWQTAIGQILQGQYANAATTLNTNALGYRLTQFSASGSTYYIASKDGSSGNYWGTYVFNPNAVRSCLSLQAPHPVHDAMTGEQATYMFQHVGAHSLMVSGAHRCLSDDPSGCHGTTDACGSDVPYRISDPAHTLESVFQTTTEVLANNLAARRFIQLHGFGQNTDDPEFIISNGTRQTPNRDFVEQVGDALHTGGNWDYKAPHLDTTYNKLIATSNTQGRFLNNYDQGDICSGNRVSTSVTGRFLHIEQFNEMRTNPSNYPAMANALLTSEICDCTVATNKPVASLKSAISRSGHLMEIRYGATSVCHLETELPSVQLSVYNLMGQVMAQHIVQVSGSADVDLMGSALPKGTYIVAAFFGTERQTLKFVVQ